jgi:hypothetical protein
MPKNRADHLKRSLPWVFLFALTLIFFIPVIFQHKTFYAFDILRQHLPWTSTAPEPRPNNTLICDPINIFYPYYVFLKSSLQEGILPFWNTSLFCGLPFSLPSHPIVILLYSLFPTTTAHDLLLGLHLLGAGIFTYLYLREIGLRKLPALIGGTSWMFNGYVMVWFEFENVLLMAFSLPLTLFLIERWLRLRTKAAFVLLITAVSLSIAVHYAHLLIYQFLFLGIYVVYRCLARKSQGEAILRGADWKGGVTVLVAFLIGMAVCTNFFVSHFFAFEGSQRQPSSFEALFSEVGQLPLNYLVTLLFPDFFGSPTSPLCFTPGSKAYNNYNELCIYVGIGTLFLVVATLPFLRKRYIGFFWLTTLASITMAMGSLLYYPMVRFVPGLNLSTPTRILYLFGFVMSILAALGAEELQACKEGKRGLILTAWALLLGVGIAVALCVQTRSGVVWATDTAVDLSRIQPALLAHFHILSNVILKPLLLTAISLYLLLGVMFVRREKQRNIFLGLLLVLLAYDLMSFGSSYNTVSPKAMAYPKTGAIEFLQKDRSLYRVITFGNFLSNAFVPFDIQDVGGYSSFYSRRYGEYLHLTQRGLDVSPPKQYSRWVFFRYFGSSLLDLLNVKYLLTPATEQIQSSKLELVYDDEIRIYRNRDCFPRIFFVSEYVHQDDAKDAYETVGRFSAEDFRKTVVVENLPPSNYLLRDGIQERATQAKIIPVAYQANRIELDVSAPTRGFLVISDAYHPRWEAKIDGREASVMRANYVMRAVPVPAGDHRVTLFFRPDVLILGFVITALGWTALLGVGGILVFKSLQNRVRRNRLR